MMNTVAEAKCNAVESELEKLNQFLNHQQQQHHHQQKQL
jgi:hypothetical protein